MTCRGNNKARNPNGTPRKENPESASYNPIREGYKKRVEHRAKSLNYRQSYVQDKPSQHDMDKETPS